MNRIVSYLVFTISALPYCLTYAASYDATILFANKAVLSIPVSGQIKQVTVGAGQQVEKGQVMIALDPIPFDAAVTEAEARVMSATAVEKEAARDYDQAKELYDRAVLSTVELENKLNSHIRAQAELQAAKARLTQANYNLKQSRIQAPADGWVLKVQARVNESINSQVNFQPLMEFAESGKYIAHAKVPLSVVKSLKVGKKSTVIVAGKKYAGTVSSVALEPVSLGKDSYNIEVSFNSGKTLIQGGQGAKLEF